MPAPGCSASCKGKRTLLRSVRESVCRFRIEGRVAPPPESRHERRSPAEAIFFAALERPRPRSAPPSWTGPAPATRPCAAGSSACWPPTAGRRLPGAPGRRRRRGWHELTPRLLPARRPGDGHWRSTSWPRRAGRARWAGWGITRCWRSSAAAAWASCCGPSTRSCTASSPSRCWPRSWRPAARPGSASSARAGRGRRQPRQRHRHPRRRGRRPGALPGHAVHRRPHASGETRPPGHRCRWRGAAHRPQVAAGLAAAHARGLVHRDVKPANILLENGVERVKITDFGLARAVDDASLTQSGLIAGTPAYMSPEQADGTKVDHRSDLFSLGSVLYALCAGRPPFRAETTLAVLKRVCEDTPRPLREVNPDIPDWLEAIIARLHAKDPAERFQTAAEVAELLGRHLAHLQQHGRRARRLPRCPAGRHVGNAPCVPPSSPCSFSGSLAAAGVVAYRLSRAGPGRPAAQAAAPGGSDDTAREPARRAGAGRARPPPPAEEWRSAAARSTP